MPAFVKQFGYRCREDAHDTFVALLSSTDIPLRARASLQQKYDVWRRNSGEEYWSSVSASLQIKISTHRTAEHLSLGGENVVGNFVKDQIASVSNPAFSLPPHNLDKCAETSTYITDLASSLDPHVLDQDSARISSTAGRKRPRDLWDGNDGGLL
ncbi:hypothetical protein BGZ50_009653, partial [Haplosporangium sp. Z 11]